MKKTLLLLLIIFVPMFAYSQEKESVKERRERLKENRRSQSKVIYREFGFNMVSILHAVPLFPVSQSQNSSYSVFYKSMKAGRNRLFRMHAGGGIGSSNQRLTEFNLKIGSEYNRTLSDNWGFYYGYDFLLFIDSRGQSSAGIGVGPIFGIKYQLNDFITFGTEGTSYLTLAAGDVTGIGVFIRPVSGLYFSFRLFN